MFKQVETDLNRLEQVETGEGAQGGRAREKEEDREGRGEERLGEADHLLDRLH
jgi:hypothetical protein